MLVAVRMAWFQTVICRSAKLCVLSTSCAAHPQSLRGTLKTNCVHELVGRDGLELPPGAAAMVTNGRVVLADAPSDEDQSPGDGRLCVGPTPPIQTCSPASAADCNLMRSHSSAVSRPDAAQAPLPCRQLAYKWDSLVTKQCF